MFRVTVTSLEDYFTFDRTRESDLRASDATIRANAPTLKRWFVPGARDGKAGMRMTMIGYGEFFYTVQASSEPIRWPVIGLALQKNYISLYCSARDGHRPFVLAYKKALGEVDASATGVIRFSGGEQIDIDGLGTMVRDLEKGLAAKRLSLRYGRAAKTATGSAFSS